MEIQRNKPASFEGTHHEPHRLPQFPTVPTGPFRSKEASASSGSPQDAMNIDNLLSPETRSQRASSVTSGMSLEDIQAAETLEFLKTGASSPRPQLGPPQWIGSQSEYPPDQQEPLLHLLTSSVPLLSSAVNNSLYAYSQTKSYSPVIRYPVEFLERNIGNPVADTIGAVGRRTGVEGGIRWALQGSSKKRKIPIEHGVSAKQDEMDIAGVSSPSSTKRRMSQGSETLPAYDEEGRSPPYQAEAHEENAQQLMLRSQEKQPPPGWQTRLMVSTSGLGVAMSDQSRRNLKYCLSWLRWANERLAGVIVAITNVLKEWEGGFDNEDAHPNKAAMYAKIQALSQDVAETVKRAVVEVSNYAGGALPQNARDLVHRYFNALPHRWRYASTMADTNAETQKEDETVSNGKRALALAREGLTMMTQVTKVVNDTLVSAENWCERLGRGNEPGQGQVRLHDGDVKMEDSSDWDKKVQQP